MIKHSDVVMDSTALYEVEERAGRRRKNRRAIETTRGVIDMQIFLLRKIQDSGDTELLKKTYDFFVEEGYEYIE